MKIISIIYKIQIVIVCSFLVSCSQLGSLPPKTAGGPYNENVLKLNNGAVGFPPDGYCIGPSRYNSNNGNVIYTACEMTKGLGMVSISFAPMETGDKGKITQSYLANNQKIIKSDAVNGYELVKVENSRFSVKSVQNTVWRTAKTEKGYVVLAQYFLPSRENVSDLHQMEVLSTSIDNFSPPDNLASSELLNLDPSSTDQRTKTFAKPKIRPVKAIRQFHVPKIRPKLRP